MNNPEGVISDDMDIFRERKSNISMDRLGFGPNKMDFFNFPDNIFF